MPSNEICPLVRGILGIILLWFVFRTVTRKSAIARTTIAKTANTREYLLFVCNLVIVAIGTSIAVYALVVAAGASSMTTTELNQLVASAQSLIDFVWTLIGVAVGVFIIFVGEASLHLVNGIKAERKVKRDDEIRPIAHAIWESQGCPNGHDREHWQKAEAIWKEQHKKAG